MRAFAMSGGVMATTSERGYGAGHQALRRTLLAQLKANPGAPCARCGRPMYPDQPLDLDHDDDRTTYRGLAHRSCNRGAGAKLGATRRWGKTKRRLRRW